MASAGPSFLVYKRRIRAPVRPPKDSMRESKETSWQGPWHIPMGLGNASFLLSLHHPYIGKWQSSSGREAWTLWTWEFQRLPSCHQISKSPPTYHFWTLLPRSASLPSTLTLAMQTACMWMHELKAQPRACESPGPSSPFPPLPQPNTHLPIILSPFVPGLAEIRSRLSEH